MGYKLVKFNVCPKENEQIDAIVKVPKEPRSVIHGVVLDECNKPRKDAVVKLFKECKKEYTSLEPITHTFTDENGQFLFGPLCPNVNYVIKVWINHINNKEIFIKPGDCDDFCLGKKHDHDDYRSQEDEPEPEPEIEETGISEK